MIKILRSCSTHGLLKLGEALLGNLVKFCESPIFCGGVDVQIHNINIHKPNIFLR